MTHPATQHPLVVIHTPAGGGHKAAARAIHESASSRGIASVVLDALELSPGWFRQAYVSTHLGASTWLPSLYGGAYFASNQRVEASEELRRQLDRVIGAALVRRVRALEPVAVVATHFYPLTVLGDARKRGEISAPVIGVVTDYAAHAVWAEPNADAICAPAGRAIADLRRHGIAPGRAYPTGIPVRPAFSRIAEAEPPQPGQPLQVLITSGGFGVGPLLDTMRSFTGVADVQLTVVCGDNPELVARARRLAARRALDAEVVGYENDMPARVAQAHVVVGKPGGLTTTECLVAHRPMVLVGAVPGQETLNQAWLTSQGFARAASAARVGPTIDSLRRQGALALMSSRAAHLARAGAADSVIDVALGLAQADRAAA